MKTFFFRDSKYRLEPLLSFPLSVPVALRSTGHYCQPYGWHDNHHVGDFYQLLWSIEGEGTVLIDQQSYQLPPDFAVIIPPGDPHEFFVSGHHWRYRWCTYDGEKAKELMDCFNLTWLPLKAGHCPDELFQQMSSALLGISQYDIIKGSTLVFEMLNHLQNTKQTIHLNHNFLSRRFTELVAQKFNDATFDLNVAASLLLCHRTTLTRAVKRALLMNPADYLLQVRVQQAIMLLRQELFTVEEISEKCGFSSPSYFAKIIRKFTNCSPQQLRKKI